MDVLPSTIASSPLCEFALPMRSFVDLCFSPNSVALGSMTYGYSASVIGSTIGQPVSTLPQLSSTASESFSGFLPKLRPPHVRRTRLRHHNRLQDRHRQRSLLCRRWLRMLSLHVHRREVRTSSKYPSRSKYVTRLLLAASS